MNAPQLFALAFLLLTCTRGTAGVAFVGSHLRNHWKVFRSKFYEFCKGLVSASRSACLKHGQQFLCHREGLHAGLSGKHFLDTLARREHRDALWRVSKQWGALIQGVFFLVVVRGRRWKHPKFLRWETAWPSWYWRGTTRRIVAWARTTGGIQCEHSWSCMSRY